MCKSRLVHDEVSFAHAQVMYYDGQFDDSRYNVALAVTAAAAGAAVANHCRVEALLRVRCGAVGVTELLAGEATPFAAVSRVHGSVRAWSGTRANPL
jgi:glycerol-3-phosphate dehydrogenase